MTTTLPLPSAATDVVEAPHDWPAGGWAKLALTSYRSNRLPSVDCCAAIAPPRITARPSVTSRERLFMGAILHPNELPTPNSQLPTPNSAPTTNHQPDSWLQSACGLVRHRRAHHRRIDAVAGGVSRQDTADRQPGKPVWVHAAVCRPRSALPEVQGPGLRGAGISLQSVRRAGAGRRSRDSRALRVHLRRDVPDVREDRRQRQLRAPAVPAADQGTPRAARYGANQVELHEISGERERGRGAALCAVRCARGDRRRCHRFRSSTYFANPLTKVCS